MNLVLTELFVSPLGPTAGEETIFRAAVRVEQNVVPGDVAVRFAINGAELTVVMLPGPLVPNQTYEAESTAWNAVQGTSWVEIQVDPENIVLETDEGDNLRTLELFVPLEPPPPPDLSIPAEEFEVEKVRLVTDFTPPVPNPSGGLDVSLAVRNIGPGTTEGGFNLTLQACGRPPLGGTCETFARIDERTLLAPGDARVLHAWWPARLDIGDVEIVAMVAYDDTQTTTENDDARSRAFVIAGGSGLGGLVVPWV